ncbi:hypothetical protein NPX13_g9374 [Xylaria arbuscula]|uniref:Uncharacterized protein n=1 Tax=Xylaria arbuscula TaxID=114810 RepID=A0A9W8N6P5_9PEZI|nr:hypothetical protein NPX13_g9374 [Xylaria arbuscula]
MSRQGQQQERKERRMEDEGRREARLHEGKLCADHGNSETAEYQGLLRLRAVERASSLDLTVWAAGDQPMAGRHGGVAQRAVTRLDDGRPQERADIAQR